MSDLAVQIMLHGLIALVPIQGGDGANHMTALLVDARQPREAQCSAQHSPKVTFVASNQECAAAGCAVSGQECTCALDFQEITLTPDVQPAGQVLRRLPVSSLPANPTQATDFAYVANLSAEPLDQALDPAFLAPVPPRSLVARMTFPFESITACALSTRRGEDGDTVVPMSFRRLGAPANMEERTQAVAQMLIARYRLPADSSGNPRLTLTLRDFGGDNPRTMALMPGPEGYFIRLVNERAPLPVDDPCDDGVGRDFAYFYELAKNPPAWQDRMIPHVQSMAGKSAAELFDPACQMTKDPMSRPVCPIGSFYPGSGISQ